MSGVPSASELLTPMAVLVASFVGSLHCAGMCGPIALGTSPRPATQAAYHLGRGLLYVTFGALGGALGRTVFPSVWGAWIATALLATYFLWAAWLMWRGGREPSLLPAVFTRWIQKPLGRVFPRAPTEWAAALSTGILTAFLPCGWLHLFLASAVATRQASQGAAVMAAFWIGTIPALAGGAFFLRKLFSKMERRRPALAAVVLIFAALAVLGARTLPLWQAKGAEPVCHHFK